jgi:hypothetical protein
VWVVFEEGQGLRSEEKMLFPEIKENRKRAISSDFPIVGEAGQFLGTPMADVKYIFDSDSADSGHVKTRFHSEDGAQGNGRDGIPWGFMDFEAQAVSDTVKESSPATFLDLCWVALLLEPVSKIVLYSFSVCVGASLAEGLLLAENYGVAKVSELFGGTSFDKCAGDIAKVARFCISRKDIKDDGLVSSQGAGSPFVGVASLTATADNRVTGKGTMA